ncbi:MAG: beta-lactamase family protein [Methanoregulaceae archaeon]|nr:beta-lactamase family protein [Methanoregulaceae archaeon]
MLTAIAFAILGQAPNQADITAHIEKFRDDNRIVGMSVLAMRDGKVIYQGAFGHRNREAKELSRIDDLYRLGSVSKSITAIAAVRMVERSEFRLDDDARKFIPELAKDHPMITPRQLLSHTAGIRHYRPLGDPTGSVYTSYKTAAEAMKLLKGDELIAEPGSKYSYSTHGYTYMARFMESIAKRPIDSVLRTHVFGEASPGLLDVEWIRETKPQRTALYNWATGKESSLIERRDDNSWKFAGGGMEANVRGLAQVGDALLAGRLLSERGRRELWTPSRQSGDTRYALGFSVGTDGTVNHNGAQPGCRAAWLLDPATKTTVVALCNTSGNIPIGALVQRVYQMVK